MTDDAITLPCGHDEQDWYSICSRHPKHDPACNHCNVGRCIKCQPDLAAIGERAKFSHRNGSPADPFPNLGVRQK